MSASKNPAHTNGARTRTGIEGLDNVLAGGLTPNRLYLVEGVPGAGKTTLAMQYLLEGVRVDEPVLYVTLSESAAELHAVAESHGWRMDGVRIHEVAASHGNRESQTQYTIFHPSEIELGETSERILAEVERVKPRRVVLDSLSELRLLSGNALQYRRQILALKHYFMGRNSTVLLLDDCTAQDHDLQVHSIAHGVILLEQLQTQYGAERRRLRVVKYRGSSFRGGYHDYNIRRGGLDVFPRLVAAEHRQSSHGAKLASGIEELDRLLGGGIDLGTSTLILGGAGTGKSTLAAQVLAAAADGGTNGMMLAFDESISTLLQRSHSLGIPLGQHLETGRLNIQPVDPAEMSPGELVHGIRRNVDERDVRVVVIDSLNGYLNAMPEERFLVTQLHELLMYLGQREVATILISAHHGFIGSHMTTAVDASYLADAAILLRYFEAKGEIRQAISVIKKRGGEHERTIREFRLQGGRIRVGEPLREFRGILTGVPEYTGFASPKIAEDR